jgi:ABC-type microcin C transport system duplicated ATPase subunit YejF
MGEWPALALFLPEARSMSEAILSARSVSKLFGGRGAAMLGPSDPAVIALGGVDLDIVRNRTLGIVGESGSGKTTLARLLLLLDRPTSGQILFEGQDAAKLDAAPRKDFRRRIQPVFQNPYSSLNPRMSVGAIIAEPLRSTGAAPVRERRERARESLVKVGLSPDDARRFPGEFSGGQRQRIAIARAIASRPDLVILDEPVSSQDISVRAQILNLLKDLQAETGMAFLLITHDLSILRFMCDDVAVMQGGLIVEQGPASQVCDAPQNAYTQALMASALSIDNRAAAGA